MKEPFVPRSTISEMLPIAMRRQFFARIFGRNKIYGYKGDNKSVEQNLERVWNERD